MRAGGIACIPTDTVYGLACDPDAEEALAAAVGAQGAQPEESPPRCSSAGSSWRSPPRHGWTTELTDASRRLLPGR